MKRKRLMMLAVTLVTVALSVTSCTKDGYETFSYDNPTIFSYSNKVLLSEIILYISPYIEQNGQKHYIVAEKLTDLLLKVNGKEWPGIDSYTLDVANMSNTEVIGGYLTTKDVVKYPFKIGVQISAIGFTTAGEYAALVKNHLNLKPGSYICQIPYFSVENSDRQQVKVYTPMLNMTLNVFESHASAPLGEFEVRVR